jgi:signal peptidase I
MFNMLIRPMAYALITAAVLAFYSPKAAPVPKAFAANMVALLSITALGMTLLIVSITAGAGINIMVTSPPVIIRNLWERGLIIILGEIIRFVLIKNAKREHRTAVMVFTTIALAIGYMGFGVHDDAIMWAVFYETIFFPLVISAVLTGMATNGSLFSLILVAFVYKMSPYLTPVIPNVYPITWTLILSGLIFATAVVFRLVTKDREKEKRLKRTERFTKNPIRDYFVPAVIMLVIAAFFAGIFPVYPVVVLTNSMQGTFERGSIVFVQRVQKGTAFARVGENEVIHFAAPNGIPYIHRVTAFRLDNYGRRQYITQGDASETADPFPVPQENVMGIARAHLPIFGYPYIFFRTLTNR